MKTKKILLPLAMLLMMTLSLTSCYDDDHRHYSPIVGSWELLEDQYGIVPQQYVDYLHFYADGRGDYEAYDYYGYWTNWNFWWTKYDGWDNLIKIRFDDGTMWEYYWELERGYLYLYDRYNPNVYLIYRPLY